MHPEVLKKCGEARQAATSMAGCPSNLKNKALEAIATGLEENREQIIAANAVDLENLREKSGYSKAFHDRLLLDEKRVAAMADGLMQIASLDDPLGEISNMRTHPNGLQIGLARVPIGVVGIIYEARPNVTIDAAGLTLKAGNTVVLRGSSEALHSNRSLVAVIHGALKATGLPPSAVSLIEDPSRDAAVDLMKAASYLDLLIPRGGPSLIKTVIETATIPVIQTGAGNCHTYIDEDADLEMALSIAVNAKVQRPGVCNAMETLLVHQQVAPRFLPDALTTLLEHGVEVRGCPVTATYSDRVKPAFESDWETEYLDLILAVKVVDNFDLAVDHINRYGTGHSEAIITGAYDRALAFLNRVDAAAVYVNASTRFTDGFEFGLGAEMGISTQKLHARGPMGLEALTSRKYVIFGSGQIRT